MSTKIFSDVSNKEIDFEKEKMMGTLKIVTLVQPSYFNTPATQQKPLIEEVTIDMNSEEITKVKEVLDSLHKLKEDKKSKTTK